MYHRPILLREWMSKSSIRYPYFLKDEVINMRIVHKIRILHKRKKAISHVLNVIKTFWTHFRKPQKVYFLFPAIGHIIGHFRPLYSHKSTHRSKFLSKFGDYDTLFEPLISAGNGRIAPKFKFLKLHGFKHYF